MKRLGRDHHIYFLDPSATPANTIDSGEELMVETRDVKGPATGPICVNGAEAGDALKVEFLSITPKAQEGAAHMVMSGRGFLDEDFTEPHCTSIALEGSEVVLPGGLRFPQRPSMGFVATTPAYRQTTASDSGPYGGDIDMQELV